MAEVYDCCHATIFFDKETAEGVGTGKDLTVLQITTFANATHCPLPTTH